MDESSNQFSNTLDVNQWSRKLVGKSVGVGRWVQGCIQLLTVLGVDYEGSEQRVVVKDGRT